MRFQCICVVCKKQFITQWKTATCGYSDCRQSLGDTDEKRFFFDRVLKREDGCWEWLGGKDKCGNPVVNLGRGKCVSSGKYAKNLLQGIDAGLARYTKECGNQLCVNPDHLMNDWDRLQSRMSVNENGCHIWSSTKDKDGYAIGWLDGKVGRVSRILWEKEFGQIPEGLQVCHRCDETSCVNVKDHCFLGDAKANSDDKISKNREARGVLTNVAVLNEDAVLEARILRSQGMSAPKIIEKLGLKCSEGTLQRCITGETWKHVGGPIAEKKSFKSSGRLESQDHSVKLSPEIAEEIRRMHSEGKSVGQIAWTLDLDASEKTIMNAALGKTWMYFRGLPWET